ncbi:hypothetical protein B9M82_02610 [Mycobacteroides abscessus]|nr:hypothetical protein B9M82_02610 [Mycobacteroides abscessus]
MELIGQAFRKRLGQQFSGELFLATVRDLIMNGAVVADIRYIGGDLKKRPGCLYYVSAFEDFC